METYGYIWEHLHRTPVATEKTLIGLSIIFALVSTPLLAIKGVPWPAFIARPVTRKVITIVRWVLAVYNALIILSWTGMFVMATRLRHVLYG